MNQPRRSLPPRAPGDETADQPLWRELLGMLELLGVALVGLAGAAFWALTDLARDRVGSTETDAS